MEKAQNMFVNEQGKTHEEKRSNEYFINPIPTNWEMNNSSSYSLMDQNDGFESALSSMVSSPTATATNNGGGENNIVVLRELIGRLGSICNSSSSCPAPGDIISSSSSSSPHPTYNNYTSANTSCYSTPLNSPPKLSSNNNKNLMLMTMTMENGGNMQQQQQQHFPNFSTDPGFAQRAATFSSFANNNNTTFQSVSNPLQEADRKFRSSNSRIQCDSMQNSPSVSDHHQHILPPPPGDGINSRKRKSIIPKAGLKGKDTPAPAPKDANVTGKAVMLDEIINYVQSLQRQVEFLSMKLATINPRMDLNMEAAALMSKDMFQPRHNIYPPSDTYPFQSQPNLHTNGTQTPNNFNAPIHNFSQPASQMSTFWEDDLHSIVQMGFGQHQTQNFQGTVEMKVEL
ncbi:hypothetical protein BUALT_Bualt14G0026000 [Buddleja alternifolia]|uniref:Uncharacterized protein n=1 Tax=Buddleja alternifolia TaxID=168488 RepID=A0AAV6WNW9_9LAMI|nr:hypothetical protein BUALT_Bualt14G0026000 [Buddleja alternifolia]